MWIDRSILFSAEIQDSALQGDGEIIYDVATYSLYTKLLMTSHKSFNYCYQATS